MPLDIISSRISFISLDFSLQWSNVMLKVACSHQACLVKHRTILLCQYNYKVSGQAISLHNKLPETTVDFYMGKTINTTHEQYDVLVTFSSS